jgi:hypothetical protein
LKQIEHNRHEKVIKDEMREQENAAMISYLESLQLKDLEDLKAKKIKQKTHAVTFYLSLNQILN